MFMATASDNCVPAFLRNERKSPFGEIWLSFRRSHGGYRRMPDPKIESLLILQDRDQRQMDLEAQLAAVPGDISDLEAKIASEKNQLESAKARLRELEVARKDLDNQVASAEQQIVRYKNQQLQVKKNEEYQALTHEIETTQAKIGELEEKGIQVLLDLDEEKKRVAEIEKNFGNIIRGFEDRIGSLRDRDKSCRGELADAKAAVEEARGQVDGRALSVYDRQRKAVRFPLVAPVFERTCQGCHLKISGEVDSNLRDPSKITTCDSCGRILYFAR